MFEREVVNLLDGQVVFVATVNGIAPQVRPMQAQIDENGVMWLCCPACRRADEVAVNDRAALCVIDEDGALLRMNGQLEPVNAQVGAEYAPKSATYRLRIHSILYNPFDGGSYTQVELPQELDGILLNPDANFLLLRR